MTSVEKSAPKWTFMRALNLDDDNEAHQDLYSAMKRETVAVYDDLLKGRRHTLQPRYHSVPEPWSYSHFTDAALRQATERICARASSRTYPLYARGQGRGGSSSGGGGGGGGDNWVVQWMLYHICRYRDSRNLRCRSGRFHEDDDVNLVGMGKGVGSGALSGGYGHSSKAASSFSSSSSKATKVISVGGKNGKNGVYYDAARNSYR